MNTTATETVTTLEATHKRLESELRMLTRRGHLTPEEQERARVLKKEKLRTKDRIRVLTSRARVA